MDKSAEVFNGVLSFHFTFSLRNYSQHQVCCLFVGTVFERASESFNAILKNTRRNFVSLQYIKLSEGPFCTDLNILGQHSIQLLLKHCKSNLFIAKLMVKHTSRLHRTKIFRQNLLGVRVNYHGLALFSIKFIIIQLLILTVQVSPATTVNEVSFSSGHGLLFVLI